MGDPRKKNLRLAIKEMVFTSSRKVLGEEAIFNFLHVLCECPVPFKKSEKSTFKD